LGSGGRLIPGGGGGGGSLVGGSPGCDGFGPMAGGTIVWPLVVIGAPLEVLD
jgi:hypothetical protein